MKLAELLFPFLMAGMMMLIPNLTAQQNPSYVDSMILVVADMEHDSDKIASYNQLAELLKNQDPDRALYFSRQALALANQVQSAEACAVSNKILADIFETKHNFQPAINYYLISIKHFKSLENYIELARIYIKLGYIYMENQFDYEQGMNYFRTALEYAEKVESQAEIATAYNAIGGVYYNQQDYDDAYLYFKKSLDIRKKLDSEVHIAASLNNVGEIYRIQGDFDRAIDYYNQAVQLNEKHEQWNYLATNYLNLALIASEQSLPDKAIDLFQKSKELTRRAADTVALIKVMVDIGRHYNKFARYDEAIQLFKEVIDLSFLSHDLEGQRDANFGLSVAYEHLGNMPRALDYFKKHTLLKDSLFNLTKADQLDELHTRFSVDLKEKELEIKDSEIALLQREKKIFRFRQLLLLLSLLFIIFIAVLSYLALQYKHRKRRAVFEEEAALNKKRHELVERELRLKSNELTNFALHLVEKNKFLHELKAELKRLRHTPADARENRIKELALTVQQNINMNKELEEFQKTVDQVNAAFFVRLKEEFPTLTKNESNLCAMLRMNLSSKEIASLNNITVRAVEMSRYRLRKKFKLTSDIGLTDFLQEF